MSDKNKFPTDKDQYYKIDHEMMLIKRKISDHKGSDIDPELVYLALEDILHGTFYRGKEKDPRVMKLISEGQTFTIEECDGTETIYTAATTKKIYAENTLGPEKCDRNRIFKDRDHPSQPTKATDIEIYRLIGDTNFPEITKCFGVELDKLCLTQHQINLFCEKYKDAIMAHRDDAIFFLSKEKGSKGGDVFCVTYVHTYYNGLCPFGSEWLWQDGTIRFGINSRVFVTQKQEKFIVES